MFNTSNANNYQYTTKHLEIHILGGIKLNKLENLRITLSVQKPKQHNILRHSIDLYNDNQVEKFVRKIAERLEIGTSVTRKTLQELTGYFGLISATHFGVIVPVISVQTVPLS